MGPDAPAVVALVVAAGEGPGAAGRGAGQRLEQALAALAEQDYPNYSVLVVGPAELASLVASRLPDAHFAPLPEGAGFAEGANLGVAAVEGAAHVLVCHEDVALAPDALRLLVEEAYRSNAGLTCPKLLSWGEPSYLLSVGMAADHWGGVHPLVEPGELDQGQHDAVREVFVAPTVAVLVRADLWRALGGMTGSDLDLCWRAQLAGARVVVAPQAVARHFGSCGVQLGQLREPERLRTLWTCYGTRALLLVAPLAVLFAIFEAVWALARPPRRRAGRPLLALVESLRAPRELWGARRRAQRLRLVSDWALWKAQSSPASLLRAALSERVERAATFEDERPEGQARARGLSAGQRSPAGTPSPAVSEGARWAMPLGRKWLALAAVCLAVLLVAGSRGLLSGPLPIAGQLPSVRGGIGSWWQAWWSGPGTPGLGGVPFGPPALLVLGLLGVACLGSAGLALHLAVLAPLAIGPLGAYLGARRLLATSQRVSERGPLAAGVLYAAIPIPYNAIANGHLAGLVSYAAAPWLLAGIARLPYRQDAFRSFARLALVAAVVGAFSPPALLVAPVLGASLAAGSLLTGQLRGAHRHLLAGAAVGATAFLMLLPWSVGVSLASTGAARPGLAALLRFDSGPFGGSWLGWAFLAAAALPLLIGRQERLAWAGRMWAVTMAFLALAWAWSPLGGAEQLLAPAAAAIAYSAALGEAAVEVDLPGYRFGWRQFAPAFGVAAALAASLPLVSWAAGGRWDMPGSGAEGSYAFPRPEAGRAYRVLWAGVPGTLPLPPQGRAGATLAFAASLDGLPGAAQLWPGPPSALARWVGLSLLWAERGETSDLGHLLGLAGVRYLVVPVTRPDAGFLAAVGRQVDLYPVGIDPSYAVYENSSWVPVLGPATTGAIAAALSPTVWGAASRAVRSVLTAGTGQGPAHGPRALYGAVPPGTWGVEEGGRLVKAATGALGSSVWFAPRGARWVPLGAAGEHAAAGATLALWAGAAAGALWRNKRRAGPAPVPEVAKRDELVLAGRAP